MWKEFSMVTRKFDILPTGKDIVPKRFYRQALEGEERPGGRRRIEALPVGRVIGCQLRGGTWLPGGDCQMFRLYVFGPSGLKDYGSAMLRCKREGIQFCSEA